MAIPMQTRQTDGTLTLTQTLDEMPGGRGGTIVALSGGRSLNSRLATLGFVPGSYVSMIQNYGRGPVIVMVRQSRCALGRGEAALIAVKEAGAT
jgi:ferrous iron transport protein A